MDHNQLEAQVEPVAYTPGDFDIAIIGMAGRFPGAASIDEFWRNLADGVEAVADFSDAEVLAAGVDPALAADPHYVKRGGVLEGAELFDARFFGIYPREAEVMDPQHRVFLEVAWEALEHAGYDPGAYPGMIGLYAGSGMNTYLLFNLSRNQEIREAVQGYQLTIANDKDYLPTRVSYKLNLRGPSINIQTACSTSLVATHLACQALLNFQCDMALAGGITIRLPQKGGYLYQEGGIASPDGHCRAFDAEAAGTVGGNGVGIVVLKRLSDALADGDTVHAVIKGTALNNDGSHKVGYTAPSSEGQTQVIANAQGLAGADPRSISYIEAHGTGTALGDPIEISALTQVFRQSTDDRQFCAIGSLKTNVGHLDAAAGVTSLIKTTLALTHKQIPPSLNFSRPNPRIDFTSSPFYVNTELRPWETAGAEPRRAGVSSFGIGGTNAHAVLEEAPSLPPTGPARASQLLILSAKSAPALDEATANLAGHLKKLDARSVSELADAAYTLQVGRQPFDHRRAAVVADAVDAVAVLSGQAPGRLLTGSGDPSARSVAFMFTGQGSQYPDMGLGLYRAEPIFREHVDHCAELLRPHLGLDIRGLLFPSDPTWARAQPSRPGETADERLRQTAITQPALFVIEYALAQLWLAWGIRPDALIGHSIGEYVALALAGVMSLADALAVVAARGRLMGALPGGSMLSLPLSEADVRARLRGYPALALATINAPALCVVAGPHETIDGLERQLTAEGVAARRLHTSQAFHSAMMDPILSPFTEILRRVKLNAPQIPIISNVTGAWLTAEQATDPAYYAQHLRQAVRFADGVAALAAEPGRALLEVGPGRTLASLAKAHPTVNRERTVITSLRHPASERSSAEAEDLPFILGALGQLWLAGIVPDWAGFHAGSLRRRIPLPTYPFERQRYWVEPTETFDRPSDAGAKPRKRPDIGDWFYLPSWRRTQLAQAGFAEIAATTNRSTLVFATNAALDGELIARLGAPTVVTPGNQYAMPSAHQDSTQHASRLTSHDTFTVRPGNVEDYDRLLAELKGRGQLPAAIVHLWTAATMADFESAQTHGFDSLIALARAWGKHGAGGPLRIDVVTAGLCDVTGDEMLRPELAPLLGACRVIPQEYPNITCRVIDIRVSPPTSLPAREGETITTLARELLSDANDPLVACRGRYRWVQSFQPAHTATDAGRTRLREHGVYLITGGLGRIGGVLAEHLAAACGARLALVDRVGLPPRADWDTWLAERDAADPTVRKLLQIRRLEGLGAEVVIVQADVADAAQMAAAVAEAEARFGAIQGVIHAAGTVGEAAIKAVAETGRPQRDAQFGPKIQGTLALAHALGDRPLDFVLLMSSVSTVLGGLGFAAYAAANSFMDAFATTLARTDSHANQPWLSVAWDGWRFTEGDEVQGALARAAAGAAEFAITPTEGAAAFERALALTDQPQVIVATGDLPARLAQWAAPAAPSTQAPAGAEARPASAKYARPSLRTPYQEPGDAIERAIAADWEGILGIAPIGAHDDFFELGGHSLLATQLVSRLRDTYQVELPLRNLFETPTVAGLAALIRAAKIAPDAAGPAVILPVPRDDNRALPLSFGQQRLWFLDQLDPGSPLYNNFAALRVAGPLDVALLERSLTEIVRRHEVLRTTFSERDGQAVQAIIPAEQCAAVTIPVIDLTGLPADAIDAEVLRRAGAEAQTPFDLTTGPLLRGRLLRTADQEHILFFTMHHIVSDGWSVGVLIRELAALYRNPLDGVLPPLPIQYADYAAWQRDWLAGELRETQLAYWRGRLANIAPLDLPTDRPRSAVQTFHGANHWFELPGNLAARLESLAKQEGATLFMALTAALQTVLARYTGQDDITIGTPIANRDRAETAGLIGFLLNTLVLRTDLAGQPTFRELLARVKETALGAYAHQDLPFEMLVEELQPARDMSRAPFFQVMFDLQAAPLQGLALPDVTLTPLRVDGGTAKFDLALSLEYGPDRLGGYLNYNTDLLDAETAAALVAHLRVLLEAAVAEPDRRITDLPLLTPDETQRILGAWNATDTGKRETRSVAEMFAAQVKQRPNATAVICEVGAEAKAEMRGASTLTLTYAELDERAEDLARHLRSLGVGAESIVALLTERSLEMVVAIMGVIKAGGAFLPIDPATPPDRIRFILDDSGASVVHPDTDRPTGAQRPTSVQHPASSSLLPAALAYVIYTSGSTGQPKGVLIEQSGLAQHLHDVAAHFGLRPGDRVLQFAAPTFDQGLEQILAALTTGCTLVVRGPEIWPPADFPQVITAYGLNVINLPPAYWNQVLQEWAKSQTPIPAGQLRLVISGGDVLTAESLRLWQSTPARGARLLNAYGPTETTVTATTFDVPGDWFDRTARPVPIGRPLPNRCAYVVDRYGQPVPIGVPGELLLGGTGVARGYLGRPELTAEKFVSNPFVNQRIRESRITNHESEPCADARLYRTGDLVRWLRDGNIEFLGRIDQQVKVRGFRIELGEIEAALAEHPAVGAATVVARADGGDKRLVAYIVPAPGRAPAGAELRAHLADRLPGYMVPSAFVTLPSLPLTASGKVDRRALPAPDAAQIETDAYVAPRTPIEQDLAVIWAQVLGVPRVGVHDNFFDLGGHSLLATQIISRAREAYPVELSLRRLFETPTVAGLANLVEEGLLAGQSDEELAALLKELEGLPDDETGEALAGEQS